MFQTRLRRSGAGFDRVRNGVSDPSSSRDRVVSRRSVSKACPRFVREPVTAGRKSTEITGDRVRHASRIQRICRTVLGSRGPTRAFVCGIVLQRAPSGQHRW
jgi:hypothetical protein